MSDVLICDRDRSFAESLERVLSDWGYAAEVTDVGSRAVQKLLAGSCGMIVLGVHEGDHDGVDMIPLVHQISRDLPVVVVGDGGSLEMERRVRLEKVFYYMVQPVDFDEMKQVVQRALQGKGD